MSAVGAPVLDVLAVPHLAAGVAGVRHDRPNGLQAPDATMTVPVSWAPTWASGHVGWWMPS
jgi:hypothetical protein